ncbi:amidohydrolase family protein [Solimonas variicoloris]|uniref:amidohydrolase family protein n=1 Tax=Solimonas variicoloris TaxID=254408 RepID=UPI0003662FE9|nr:amidohydrolase family protein [Solimonas variicoloris]
MLIRDAELHFGARVDVRIADGRIAEIGSGLRPHGGEAVLPAGGGALLPGLRDHHLHLQALAAARASIACGPPQVDDEAQLAAALRAAARTGTGWLRGVGHHESVCATLDRDWLDRHVAARPLRVQHRSGRLWTFNSAGLAALGVRDGDAGGDPFERIDGRLSGRLYDADDWLRTRLPRERPSLAAISRALAARGVVGLTDTTHTNGPDDLAHFAAAHARGELLQDLCVMGDARLDGCAGVPGVQRGAHKFHLHEHELPEFEVLCAAIAQSHRHARPVAFHCVTRAELAFALAALDEAGVRDGDRIEHAAVAPPELAAQIARLRLTVVTQPNFIAERGDAYLADVDADDRPWLYRLQGLRGAGVALAGSTDAPFGDADPWRAMQAACARRSVRGATLGADEALTPEAALALYTGPLQAPAQTAPSLAVGAVADLCLLDAPWRAVRARLGEVTVRATWRRGELIGSH